MKIAILGGGITGLTAGYYLSKTNQVYIFEKSLFLGGLAAGFKKRTWKWYLDYAYHHLFVNDKDIGFKKILFSTPITGLIFDDLKIYPMDNPIDFLKIPTLSLIDKIKLGFGLLFLKISPFLSFYEKTTSKYFIKKIMGKNVWFKLWEKLFRKKFGKYAENILASFFWARIKKRTKRLGYFEGGFQNFVNYLEYKLKRLRVNILTGRQIIEIKKTEDKFSIIYLNKEKQIISKEFDMIISTLPTPVLLKIGEKIFPANFTKNLRKLQYLHCRTLILETKKPLLNKVYWLNVSTDKIPVMGIIEHTNFIDKKFYGDHYLIYLAWYLEESDQFWQMEDKDLLNFIFPYLKKINSNFLKKDIIDFWSFKAHYAQPIFNKEFINCKPNFKTPVKNFFIANLDMTHPYDRGTNYAVKLGKEVLKFIEKN